MGLLDDLDQLSGSSILVAEKGFTSKSKARVEKDKSRAQSKDNEDRYETWTLSELQNEVRRYGFRPSKTRKLLLEQLDQVKEALEQQKKNLEVGDVSVASSSSSFLCYSMDLTSDGESVGNFTSNVIQQASKGAFQDEDDDQLSRGSIDDDDEEEEDRDTYSGDEDDDNLSQGDIDRNIAVSDPDVAATTTTTLSPNDIAPSLSNQLYKAITMDKPLYHRILHFEPVSFDEVSSTAKRAGVTGLKSKETLRNWLDMQGICFYSAELTGQRQRY